ncbi:MAG: glycosyltransferase, partial [Actinomycetota bacterium]|nr:glycosyltransferase [Actinomycetota bacterium]
ARRTGARGVLEVNAPLIDEQATHRCLVDRSAAEASAAAAFADASFIVAVSDLVATWVRARLVSDHRVHVVPNGVDPERITPRPTPMSSDTCTVGFVGTLKPWHGLATLVDAMDMLVADDDTYRLLVVGDGPERAALASRVEERGLTDHTILTGSVDPAEMPAYLHRMDVAVAPYPDLEECYFSPLKLYEYLAAALPVVASRVGQVAEVIDDGRTGLLCPPGDAAALAAAVAVLRADPHRRRALGRAGRDQVVAQHSWDRVVGRILALAGQPAAMVA